MTRARAVDPGGAVRVRVPATSANLGPGYDSFGLALALHDEVTARRLPSGLRIHVDGVGAGTLPLDASHLVVSAARAAFDAMGEPMPGLDLECVNAIPHGSGQGSSAAAIVAGILLARALTPGGDGRLPDAGVFDLASRMEGHPDNVAPALMGGLTIAWVPDDDDAPGGGVGGWVGGDVRGGGAPGGEGGDGPGGDGSGGDGSSGDGAAGDGAAGVPATARAVRLEPHPDLQAILLTTPASCATGKARAALPPMVPHVEAARNAARAALFVHAATREPSLMFPATRDWLHQPYRATVMPDSLALVRRLRARGLPAVLSGAGPTVLVLGCDLPDPGSLADGGFRARRVGLSAAGAAVATA